MQDLRQNTCTVDYCVVKVMVRQFLVGEIILIVRIICGYKHVHAGSSDKHTHCCILVVSTGALIVTE